MIKVFHVIYGLKTGGAETLVKDYVLNIDKSKFIVKVLCFSRESSPYEALLENSCIQIIYLDDYINFKGSTFFSKLFLKIKKYFLFRKILHEENPDVIHSHLLINRFVLFARPKKNTKIFYTVHTEPNSLWNYHDIIHFLELISCKILLRKYRMKFIVLHDEMRIKVNSIFKINNSLVLNNGIDFCRFSNLKNRKSVRDELNINHDSFVIGHVGRFSATKNHNFLIDVFFQYHLLNPKSFLLMIGAGEEINIIRSKLHSLHLDNCYLILSNRLDIPDLLNSIDAFVFPSIYEGLGISLIEAQKVGIPCFVSDSIPKYACISNYVSFLSLNDSPSLWAFNIFNYSKPKKMILDDKNWDIRVIIKKLENLYLK